MKFLFSNYKIINSTHISQFLKKTFYIIDVLMRRISLSHPEEKFIHWFPQNMEGAWPATPLFKKWKEAQILVAGFIPSFYAKFHEIW